MKSYHWGLGCGVIVLLLASSTVWANVDSSGFKFSVYGGQQKQIIHPGSFTLIGNETEKLVPNHSASTDFSWGLGAAYRFLTPDQQKFFCYTHDISLGLDVFYFHLSHAGNVLDYSVSPDFNYRAKIRSLRFIGNVEWTFLPITSKAVYPFLEAGAGVASNTNYYADRPNPNTSGAVGVTFTPHNSLGFAYDFGAGLKYMPSKNIEISLRYLYSNAGSVNSGTQANLGVSSAYDFPLTTQSLFLGLSYLL